MIRSYLVIFAATSLCLPLLLAGNIAMADDPTVSESQTATASTANSASQAPQVGPGLEEILVTAQRRSERLGDVPIAVVPITADMMKTQHMESTADIQFAVPALVYSSFGGYAMPYLRGIGSDIALPNADPEVATYIDGAFVSTEQATIQNLLGVQQIEVLEGPQGTLYGRNAVGGAINITTLTPTQTTSAMVSLTLGDYARKEMAAHISGGVTDDLAVGLYVAGTERNTYYTRMQPELASNYLGGLEPDHVTEGGARLKAIYTPVDWFKLTGSLEVTRDFDPEGDTVRQIDPNALGFVLYPSLPKVIAPYVALSNSPEWSNVQQTAFTLREDVDLSWAKLLGISNYRNVIENAGVDADGTQAPLLASVAIPLKSQQYSQELQLQSADGSRVHWVGGLYFFHEAGGYLPDQLVSPTLFPPSAAIQSNNASFVTKSYAVFGQATFPLIVDDVHLTIGGRYTTDMKSFSAFDQDLTLSGVVTDTTVYPDVSKTWHAFTPKVTLDYKWTDGALTYVGFSEGFKSGVFDMTVPSTPGPANPEKLYSYEIGSKIPLWNRRVSLNSSAYYYDYKNLQVQAYVPQTDLAILQNAASAKAYGVESSVVAAVTDNLNLSSAVSWEHAYYDSFPAYSGIVGGASQAVNASGNQLERAPKWVVTAGAEYTHELPAGSMQMNVNWYYNNGFYWTPQNSIKQSAYNILDASLAYTFPDKAWSVQFWGKNLTNAFYETGVSQIASFGTLVQDAPPRIFGVTGTYHFN
jgi:iron complex outermembrane receptor protein